MIMKCHNEGCVRFLQKKLIDFLLKRNLTFKYFYLKTVLNTILYLLYSNGIDMDLTLNIIKIDLLLYCRLIKTYLRFYNHPKSTMSTTISFIFSSHKSFGITSKSGAPVISSEFVLYKSGASSDKHVLIGTISKANPRPNFPKNLKSFSIL